MNMNIRYLIDSILFASVVFLFTAIIFSVIQKTYKYRKEDEIAEYGIKDNLAIRISSFVVVLIMSAIIGLFSYYTNRSGIDIINNADSLVSVYGSIIISIILKILYNIAGSFLILVSFILCVICCILIGSSLDCYLIHPKSKKPMIDEDQVDDEFDNDEDDEY